MTNFKPYTYTKGVDSGLDADFSGAKAYCKVKPGQTAIFWKSGLHWYAIPLAKVQRIFRRVERMHIRACGGGRPFVSEWLVLVLPDEEELLLHIGDNEQKKAEALLQALKDMHPEMQYGKE